MTAEPRQAAAPLARRRAAPPAPVHAAPLASVAPPFFAARSIVFSQVLAAAALAELQAGSEHGGSDRRSVGAGAPRAEARMRSHTQCPGMRDGARRRRRAPLPYRLPQLDDLDGTAHYVTLGVEPRASSADIKKARRRSAPPPPPPPLPPPPPHCVLTPPLHPECRPTAAWPSGCTPTRAATPRPLRGCRRPSRCWAMRASGRCTTPGPKTCSSGGWVGLLSVGSGLLGRSARWPCERKQRCAAQTSARPAPAPCAPPARRPAGTCGSRRRRAGRARAARTSCLTSCGRRGCTATPPRRRARGRGAHSRPPCNQGRRATRAASQPLAGPPPPREPSLPALTHSPPAAGGDVRGVPAPRHQAVLDLRHAHLRVLHPEAPLAGGWVLGSSR